MAVNPKISVAMITYNHELYIEQALESVLSQATNHTFEIIISDDQSSDRTPAILEAYRQKYPDIIHLVSGNIRLGAAKNWMQTLGRCRGQYIAVLEGDDYWTDDSKLKLQADLMDGCDGMALCFHRVHCEWEDGRHPSYTTPGGDCGSMMTIYDLLQDNIIATCSVMYRRNDAVRFPDKMNKLYCLDYATHLLHALHGSIGFLDRVMGHYRHHGAGSWSSTTTLAKHEQLYEVFKVVRPVLNKSLGSVEPMYQRDVRCAEVLMRDGYRGLARKYALNALIERPASRYAWRLMMWTLFGKINGRLRPF